MSRVKRGVTSHARHKKVLAKAKGYYGRRKNTIRVAKQAVTKAGQYAYRDRRTRKRNFRALWIQRINAASRMHGLPYGRFMDGLGKSGLHLYISIADKLLHLGIAQQVFRIVHDIFLCVRGAGKDREQRCAFQGIRPFREIK